MDTPKKLERKADKLEAQAKALRQQAQEASEREQPISPHTKLPVDHPESQAVERERFLTGISLASATKPEEIQKFLDEQDKK